ncbi:helix-turn-helix transcriptional regulator [Bacillus atrophaeus]|uniref:helix-turn-helix domain-containing protein n=1 Tax=Bacillus atrophaeus TaxID=1452 RepID=UPI001EFA5B0F|nr:helix-turn-helix transcriptional regulator [Bacillus atrophaeus]MCG8395080.1 helix-turn-helix transcriptional regulator [Bacillus atrophaeus]
MPVYRVLKCRLGDVLKEYDMTISDIAENTNLSERRLNDYVDGIKTTMTMNVAMTVAKTIGCRIEDLFVWEDS